MNAIGLKYVGNREEGISVMLFRSYKTVKVSKIQPYRFTNRDIVNSESNNYYNRLANLGLALITDESDFNVDSKFKVRREPLAAELDIQLDPTQAPKTAEDQMITDHVEPSTTVEESDDINSDQNNDETSVINEDEDETSSDESSAVITNNSDELLVDKEAIKGMSAEEISEYLEMNFSRDQLKSLINEMGLDISIGRKGAPTLVGEIVATAELDDLVRYLSK